MTTCSIHSDIELFEHDYDKDIGYCPRCRIWHEIKWTKMQTTGFIGALLFQILWIWFWAGALV